jgi:preprotein translocase subunit SecG
VQIFLNIAQIIIAVAIIVAVLLQVKGGGLGGVFGQADTVYRTQRGAEKTLFQLTIVMMTIFVIISIVSLRVS